MSRSVAAPRRARRLHDRTAECHAAERGARAQSRPQSQHTQDGGQSYLFLRIFIF